MTAVKLRIQDLMEGTYDGAHVHTPFGEVSEARILGTLVDVFVTDDDGYISLTVDDGTETVRIKAWGKDVGNLKKFLQGDLVEVVGKVREYNEEIYLTPEVISKVSPNKWILRELELMKLFIVSGSAEESADVKKKSATADARSEPGEAEPGTMEEVESEAREELTEKKQVEHVEKPAGELPGEEKLEEEYGEEIEEFEILGEDEVVETVLELLKESMTKEALVEQSALDEIDVELALRELLDERKITKEGETYRRTA